MKLSDLRKHKKFLIAVVCVLAAIAMGAVFLQPKAEPEDDVIWREYPVKLGTITASLDGSGLLEATGIHHSFDVDLKIDQILVEAGQEVKAGDTLVTYSKSALQEKIDELTASLQAAQRALEDAQNNKRKMCQRRYEIVRKRRRNFVVFRRGVGNKTKRFLAQKECSRFAVSDA